MNKRAEAKIAELVAKKDAQYADLLREAMQWAYQDAITQTVARLRASNVDGGVLASVLSQMNGN